MIPYQLPYLLQLCRNNCFKDLLHNFRLVIYLAVRCLAQHVFFNILLVKTNFRQFYVGKFWKAMI